MAVIVAVVAAVVAVALGWFAGVRRILNRSKRVAQAVIADPDEHTTMDERGAVRSVQGADLNAAGRGARRDLDAGAPRAARPHVLAISVALHARAHPRALRRRGTIGRAARAPADACCRFRAHEYEMSAERGIVRWRIERGVLVSRAGHGGDGYLKIDVRRCAPVDAGTGRVHVEVEGLELLPGSRERRGALVLLGDPVAHPRHRHARVPALARAPGPRGSPSSGATGSPDAGARPAARADGGVIDGLGGKLAELVFYEPA